MKVLAFQSLEEANEYITKELGLPPIPEGALPPGTFAESETDTMRVRVHAEAEDDSTINSFDDLLQKIYGPYEEQMIPTPLSFGDAEAAPEMMPVSEFNAYYEQSSAQISRLVDERNAERAAHVHCHDVAEEEFRTARISGYAEAIAAGIWPNQLFEQLDEEHQDILMRQAEAAIDKLDEQRQLLRDEG